ncbi:MAG: 50S ribosomal protein L5 [Acidobacteriota bacterium]
MAVPRFKERYLNEVRPALMKELGIANALAAPRFEKIVVNMGVGEATQNIKVMDSAEDEIKRITGQKPSIRRARKSVAAFKLRTGMPIGCAVTLRGSMMYEFYDRLVSIALPRVRDFKGVPTTSFDGRGNYTMGLKDQLIFPEVDYAKVEKTRGMNITICTTAGNDAHALALLRAMGMPFKK